jgi:ankyrin repeat protein
LLLHAGADPCAADKWGITPIMIAAAIDDELLLETLLESCLSSKRLQDADQDGNTALHFSYAFCNVCLGSNSRSRFMR